MLANNLKFCMHVHIICLQIYMLANNLKFCMHIHIISSSYKKFHN
jgi:hypothetical protein